jgi:DNA-binding NtrC family response regulator
VAEEPTVRDGARGIPVRALRAEVIEGPDTGRSVAAETIAIGSAEGNDLRLTDRTVSRYHAELATDLQGVRVRDLDSTNGTFAYGVRVGVAHVPPRTILEVGQTQIRLTEDEPRELALHGAESLAGLRGRSAVMRRLMERVAQVAKSNAGVLVTGESGTGKELVARALHDLGPRAGARFVTVDCGALAPTLVASELFGHERGAFTGADERRIGAFELAHGGTLFLDEVGELPAALQASLLGVLERKRFRRLGGKDDIEVDVRVVSATHRDLRSDVNVDRFRLDLYYRLAVVTITVPPLRDRIDDIPMLAEHFAQQVGWESTSLLSTRTIEMLAAHRWPGNVRELRNWVEAAIAMGEAPELHAARPKPSSDPIGALLDHAYKDARGALLGEFEPRYLKRLLERAGGNVSEAARLAKMDRSHLNDLLRRHGLR